MAVRPASINAVALKAGVSRNTVSLALRDDRRVAPATRDRVLRAARELDYRPNLLARAVVTGRSRMLGLALPRVDFSYMPRLVESVTEVAFESGYGVLTRSHHHDPAKLAEALSYFLDRRVEGVLIHCPVPPAPAGAWDGLRRSGVPSVFFSFGNERLPGLVFDLSPQAAGDQAVRRLAADGHRRLGYAGGVRGFFEEARLDGARRAAADLGLAPPAVFEGDHSIAGGHAAAAGFLRARRRPTGVVCFADPVAVGFVQALTRAGVAVPGEVAVTGVDDLPIAEAAVPALTTLRAPAAEMGRAGAEALVRGGAVPNEHRVFQWEWIERESARPAPAGP